MGARHRSRRWPRRVLAGHFASGRLDRVARRQQPSRRWSSGARAGHCRWRLGEGCCAPTRGGHRSGTWQQSAHSHRGRRLGSRLHALPIPPQALEVPLGVAGLQGGELAQSELDLERPLDGAFHEPMGTRYDQPTDQLAAALAGPVPGCDVDRCGDLIGLGDLMAKPRRRHARSVPPSSLVQHPRRAGAPSATGDHLSRTDADWPSTARTTASSGAARSAVMNAPCAGIARRRSFVQLSSTRR